VPSSGSSLPGKSSPKDKVLMRWLHSQRERGVLREVWYAPQCDGRRKKEYITYISNVKWGTPQCDCKLRCVTASSGWDPTAYKRINGEGRMSHIR
jgi:hypothetical protein